MKKNIHTVIVFMLMTGIVFASGNTEEEQDPNEKDELEVFVSIIPQKGLVERIGDEFVTVDVLVQPGQSPHTYEPTPKQVMKVGRADIFFTLGFPFEQRVVSKLTSGSTVIEVFAADNGVQRRHLESHTFAEKESHQEHGMRDPHVWLGPPQLKTLAENTFEGLTTVAPEHREDFAENLDRFLEQLEQVDSEIAAALQGYKGKKILVFHPAFGYFCDHYEIQQVPIEIEGKSPSPKQIEQIIKQARKDNIRILFVQPQFDRKSAEKIAEVIDGAVVSLNPLHEDVLENLREIAEKIQPALR